MFHAPDTYLVGPDGHAYWLEPDLDHFSDPTVALWACPVLADGRLDFDNGLAVADFDDTCRLDIPALTRALLAFTPPPRYRIAFDGRTIGEFPGDPDILAPETTHQDAAIAAAAAVSPALAAHVAKYGPDEHVTGTLV